MPANSWPFLVCWCVVVVGLVVSGYVYFRHVLPTLRRRDWRPHWWAGMPSTQWRQVRAYGQICREEGVRLSYFWAYVWSQGLALAAVVAAWVMAFLARP